MPVPRPPCVPAVAKGAGRRFDQDSTTMITDLTRERWPRFQKLVQGCDATGRWLVLTHDNPDPDSIASAAALGRILRVAFQ